MGHTEIIKYIKSNFKNMGNDKIKYHEQSVKNTLVEPIKNNLSKQYTLKNPILCEYSITSSIEDFNKILSAENNECIKELDQIFTYKLTTDNDYFDEHIYINYDINILPIRIKKINDDDNDDDNINLLTPHISDKMNIMSIKINNYCEYILYENFGHI